MWDRNLTTPEHSGANARFPPVSNSGRIATGETIHLPSRFSGELLDEIRRIGNGRGMITLLVEEDEYLKDFEEDLSLN